MKLPGIKFNPQDPYQLATIISNEFIGSQKTISCTRYIEGFYFINSNKCDCSPLIKVWRNYRENGISKIEVLGDYTDRWQEIHPNTYERIKSELI